MLAELVAQGLHLGLPQMHLFGYVDDATLETLGTDAFVRAVMPRLGALLLARSRDLGILKLQRSSGLHLARNQKKRTNAANFVKKCFFYAFSACVIEKRDRV